MKFYNDFQKSVLVMAMFVPEFHAEKGNYFCLDLHYVHKVETGQRHDQKHSKDCFTRNWKFDNNFQ